MFLVTNENMGLCLYICLILFITVSPLVCQFSERILFIIFLWLYLSSPYLLLWNCLTLCLIILFSLPFSMMLEKCCTYFFSFEFLLSVHQSHLLYLFCLHLLYTLSKMAVLSFIWTTSSGCLFSSLHWLVLVLFCAFFVQWSIFPLT